MRIVSLVERDPAFATALLVDMGEAPDGSLARREILPPSDQYADMAEAFALAALGQGDLAWGIEDAIRSMQVLDAITESERSGGWAKVASR